MDGEGFVRPAVKERGRGRRRKKGERSSGAGEKGKERKEGGRKEERPPNMW